MRAPLLLAQAFWQATPSKPSDKMSTSHTANWSWVDSKNYGPSWKCSGQRLLNLQLLFISDQCFGLWHVIGGTKAVPELGTSGRPLSFVLLRIRRVSAIHSQG